jgi:hypothetical protein
MTQSTSASERLVSLRKSRKVREEHRQAEGLKWKRATSIRDRWTEEEFAKEALQLEAEIEAFIAAGRVTKYPAMYADGIFMA